MNRSELALKIAVNALEYMTMPVTTPKESLTVDRLLATMKEDQDRGKDALEKIKNLTGSKHASEEK